MLFHVCTGGFVCRVCFFLLRFQQGVGQSTGSTSGTRSFLAADALEVG